MKYIPKAFFFLILISYPLFGFILYRGFGLIANYTFGLLCMMFLIVRLYDIYRSGQNVVIPHYVIIFAVFTGYQILTSFIVSDVMVNRGVVKFIYSNAYLSTLVAFLIVENTSFPRQWIDIAVKAIGVTLVCAALVSIGQIFDPLFLVNDDFLVQGLSFDRLVQYYRDHPEEFNGDVARFIDGYRFSIYSFVAQLSVGIDNIAIFSLVIAYKSRNWIITIVWILSAALVSFLSSARWIMLNFLIVASQNVWINKNKVLNVIKYGLYTVTLIIILIPIVEFFGMDVQKFVEGRLMSDSAGTRIYAFEVFGKVFPDNPILGTGGADTPKMQLLIREKTGQIHVGYLKLFYYYGLAGGIIYLAFLGALLLRLLKLARISNYWGGFFAILAFAVANLTLVELNLFYYGLILALIFSNHFYYEKIKEQSLTESIE